MDNFKSGDVVCNEKDVTNDSCDADVTPLPLQAEGGDETQSMSESLITGTKDSEGTSLSRLLKAAEKNDLEVLGRLISLEPELVHAADADGYTALHRACYGNHPEAAQALLTAGASVHARTADGWEPLHCACKWGALECAVLLINHDADVNSASEGGLTPVHLAASQPKSRALLEMLLWNPFANLQARSRAGDTPRDLAARHGPWVTLFDMVADEINVF